MTATCPFCSYNSDPYKIIWSCNKLWYFPENLTFPTATVMGLMAPATEGITPVTGPIVPATGPNAPATGPIVPATGPNAPATGPTQIH